MAEPLITPDYISSDLAPLIVPIENITLLPGNYRRHEIEDIKGSVKRFKQRKPITAQLKDRDLHGYGIGICTAGNGTLTAMKELNCTHIAVAFEADTDEEAIAWAITDNHTHDKGSDDLVALADLMQQIQDHELRITTGYSDDEFLELVDAASEKRPALDDLGGNGGATGERNAGNPVVQYQIIFDDEEQQQTWYKFIRWLKRTVEGDTVSGRLTNFLDNILDGYEEE